MIKAANIHDHVADPLFSGFTLNMMIGRGHPAG
jgi:hypothetical protein